MRLREFHQERQRTRLDPIACRSVPVLQQFGQNLDHGWREMVSSDLESSGLTHPSLGISEQLLESLLVHVAMVLSAECDLSVPNVHGISNAAKPRLS